MRLYTAHPHYGEVIYNQEGKPTCHICGKSFNKLLSHVWQKHGMSAREYKQSFGLNLNQGLIAESTKNKLQNSVQKHYSKVVEMNLVKGGIKTRFKIGSEGRTRSKCNC